MGVFSYFCLEPSGLSLQVISTTPGLPPQLLCRHFLHLLAQTVQSPTVKKWQEMWVPIGLKTGSSCPPNIFLHVPLLPDFTQLRSTHMGAGFLLPCGLSQVTPYLSPPNTKTQHTSCSDPRASILLDADLTPVFPGRAGGLQKMRDEKNLRTRGRSWTPDPERKGQTQGYANLSSHPQPTSAH